MKKSLTAFLKGIVSVIAVLVFVIGVSSCQKQEGPMEKAGKKVDESIEATKKALKETGEKIGKESEKTKEAVKDAVEKAKK